MSRSMQINTLTPSTAKYLQDALNLARGKILINVQTGKDEQDALILEDFFKIVGFDSGIDNPILGIGLAQRKAILQQYGIPIGQLKGKTISGFELEEWLEKVITDSLDLFNMANLVKWDSVVKITGKDAFDLFANVQESAKSIVAETYKKASQNFKNKAKQGESSYKLKTTVFGKIDTGSLYFNLTINTNDPYLEKIIPLLAQSTFTDKGYLTKHDVRLGQTNPFRVFMAVTGQTDDALLKIRHWEAMLECMKNHPHNAPRLFYELRYMYELTGYGGTYVRDEIQNNFANGARFFLYMSGETIKVIPVSRILQNLNTKLKSNELIKSQSINMDYALYAILKMRITATTPITFELE